MKQIIDVKEGVVSAFMVIPFLLALCGFTVWCHFRLGRPTTFETLFICGLWVAFLYFPIDAMLHPKCGKLFIDGEHLTSIVCGGEGNDKSLTQDSVPLREIITIEIVFPVKEFVHGVSRDYSEAQLYLVDKAGQRKLIPSELWPGVYYRQIIAALREKIPDLRVVEKNGSPDSPELPTV
jgi:hypothetical protein